MGRQWVCCWLQCTSRLQLLPFVGKGAEPPALLGPPSYCHLLRAGECRKEFYPAEFSWSCYKAPSTWWRWFTVEFPGLTFSLKSRHVRFGALLGLFPQSWEEKEHPEMET